MCWKAKSRKFTHEKNKQTKTSKWPNVPQESPSYFSQVRSASGPHLSHVCNLWHLSIHHFYIAFVRFHNILHFLTWLFLLQVKLCALPSFESKCVKASAVLRDKDVKNVHFCKRCVITCISHVNSVLKHVKDLALFKVCEKNNQNILSCTTSVESTCIYNEIFRKTVVLKFINVAATNCTFMYGFLA